MRARNVVVAGLLTLAGCKGCKQTPPPQPKVQPESSAAPSKAPPANFALVSQRSGDDGDFGKGLSLAFDGAGAPLLAWVQRDPQNAADAQSDAIMFAGWDAQKKVFRAPVRVAPRRITNDTANRPLGFARDDKSGTLLITFDTEADGHDRIALATSKDGGATWKTGMLPAEAGTPRANQCAVAAAGGQAHVIWVGEPGILYTHAAVDADPASWPAPKILPQPKGVEGVHARANPSIAVDSKGSPGVAYGTGSKDEGVQVRFYFVRPGDAEPTKVLDVKNQNDDFDARLVFAGTNPRIAIAAAMNDMGDPPDAWSVKSDDGGKTWSKALAIPADGNHSLARSVSFALSPTGKAAFTAGIRAGNNDDSKCKDPVLSRGDLSSWSTCSPAPSADFFFQADFPVVAFHGEKLAMAFVNNNPEAMAKGIVYWTE
ncbi:MAG: exo-alpha-sialidase [Deltaproteobacteria bacterium]|nr:exo-alpha-sialidase [Deltaproteobacteria bacterium]